MPINWDLYPQEKQEIKIKYLEFLKERFTGKAFNVRQRVTAWTLRKYPSLEDPEEQFAGTFDHHRNGFFINEHGFQVTQKEIRRQATKRRMNEIDYIDSLLKQITKVRTASKIQKKLNKLKKPHKIRKKPETLKILHLTLHKKWFDLIAAGIKKEEYREIKDYWKKRLEDQEYDEIHFRNGYAKNAPFIKVEFKGISKKYIHMFNDTGYAIKLGKILQMKNYRKNQH